MTIRFRPIHDSEHAALVSIWRDSFTPAPSLSPSGAPVADAQAAYVAECDGAVAGGCRVYHFTTTTLAGDMLRCGGVAAVAVAPAQRQRGIGGAMMREALRTMRDDGCAIAALYPFRESYYRRFGYECCGRRIMFRADPESLRAMHAALPVHETDLSNRHRFQPVYGRFLQRFSGMNIRNEALWRRALKRKDLPHDIMCAGDPAAPQAYASILRPDHEDSPLYVQEFAWSSVEGHRSLLAEFGRRAGSRAVTWNEPGESLALACLLDTSMDSRLVKPIMFRALDVPGALRSLLPSVSGAFTLRVRDEDLPENQGPWRVVFGDGGVSVTSASDADITLDIRQFTQAMMGEPSLEQLAWHGLATCASPAALGEAVKLLPARPVYCLDYF